MSAGTAGLIAHLEGSVLVVCEHDSDGYQARIATTTTTTGPGPGRIMT